MTGNDVAARLGVSRRTLYRWHHEGRLHLWEWESAQPAQLHKRPRGPKRNPQSKRYTVGRHAFERICQ
jgi:hypothetical protein